MKYLYFLLAVTVGASLTVFELRPPNDVAVESVLIASPQTSTIAAGIVPHHLVADEMIKNFWRAVAAEEPETIILASPDHWGRAQSAFSTSSANATDLLHADDALLRDEHGINVHTPYLLAILPKAKVIPIAISAITRQNQLDELAQVIDQTMGERVVVVASTDFSHYLPSNAADLHDATSMREIESFAIGGLPELELDCWQCVSLAQTFAARRDALATELVGHSNSGKILGENADETTSYVSYLFSRGPLDPAAPGATMLFVGDMMFGRTVETLENQFGWDYPWQKIDQLLRGVDLVHGNLEGPIVGNHAQTPPGSVSFNFPTIVAETLREHEINVVSLGNNHTLDQGSGNFTFTKETLLASGILSAGHAVSMGHEHVLEAQVRDISLRFASFNVTFPFNDKAAAVETIQQLAAESDDPIIVNVHWGIEYQLDHHASQEQFAHELVNAGADLIIGHHPHVVQDIEVYNNVAIFYSLGNFIFDQYWSEETQEGLAVGVDWTTDHRRFTLLPLKSVKSQPQLMTQAEARPWLEAFADRSQPDLSEAIKAGIITTTP